METLEERMLDEINKPINENDSCVLVNPEILAKACAQIASTEVIDFATWYSGMERKKIESAYERYLTENKHT